MNPDRRAAVADELEIRNVLAAVALITDGWRTLDEYLDLWTEDCVWRSPIAGEWTGHEGQRRRHDRLRAEGVQGPAAKSFHLVTNVWVSVAGDEAASRSSWQYLDASRMPPTTRDVGVYDDRLRRTPDGWKLARREVTHTSDGTWLREKADRTENG